ncbi:PilZ domain-containing protein [Thiohalorhabdus methylotrophus]|uniref:PilZ domain-containing protein n=1 Tax=Thiohalorhabdus methylotrophus TaxID=3242694 RepID=A0ABV4TXY3_9GAMM
MNDQASNSSGKDAAPKGAEQREHFRVNADLRISVAPLGEDNRKPWAHAEEGGISPLIGPSEPELKDARERIQVQPHRKVNLSAGGFRTGFGGDAAWDKAPEVAKGDRVSVALELQVPEETGVSYVHLPATVIWVEHTSKWVYMACQFARMPTGVERVLTQFVMEVERRRLRPS